MKLAIHHREGSFSNHWIEYCKIENIPFKVVDCYHNNIIKHLEDCWGLMWHHHHLSYKDVLFSKELLFSIQQAGKIVFPDFNSGWHFDDKVGQKYLLESISAPLIPSYVFYEKSEALNWAKKTTYPKVFKLRGGSNSLNVKLVKDQAHCNLLIKQAFKNGFPQYDSYQALKDRYRRFKKSREIKEIFKGLYRIIAKTEFSKMHPSEKGYVYFQDFIPDNDFDIRLIVIEDKAFGVKRLVREGDFRASGSKTFVYDKIDNNTLTIAFSVAEELKLQCVAFDFVYLNGSPLIVEMSYGFGTKGVGKCTGYWDKSLRFHEGQFNPYSWIIDNLLKSKNK